MARRKQAGSPCQACESRQSQIRTLEMQLSAQDAVIAMQNGALDEIGALIEQMPGGLLAKIQYILERHGVRLNRPQKSLQ